MNLSKKLSLLLVGMLLLVSSRSSAFPDWLGRFEIGYSYVMATGQFSGVTGVYNSNFDFVGDTQTKKNIVAKAGFGGLYGTYFPVKKFEKGCLAIDVTLMANFFIWGKLNQGYNTDGSNYTPSSDLTGATVQYALPIGLDYKFGPEGVTAKHPHLGFSLGAGVMTSMSETIMDGGDNGGAGFALGVTPYAKGEVVFFAGICMKLRAMFSFGDIPYIDQSKSIASYSDGPFKVTGKSNLTLSFIIMPFSWGWQKHGWWDTY